MSAKIKSLSPGESLFRAGDPADGMYVIRKGQILVYLEKSDKEIPLAVVASGGMVGEMGFIDSKPRSASARALDAVELSYVSNDDFNRILQEIPRWFRTLMSALSSKLRETNEHLKKMEEKAKLKDCSLDIQYKRLSFIWLLWQRMGSKDPKSWTVDRKAFEDELKTILHLTRSQTQALTDALVSSGIMPLATSVQRGELLTLSNRGDFERFLEFIQLLRKKESKLALFLEELAELADLLAKMSKASPYDFYTISLSGLIAEGTAQGFVTSRWSDAAVYLSDLHEAIGVTAGTRDPGFRVNKSRVTTLVQYLKTVRSLNRI
jgi:CRP-like cAMP-binding protein